LSSFADFIKTAYHNAWERNRFGVLPHIDEEISKKHIFVVKQTEQDGKQRYTTPE
jgi:hypothetical protein